MSPRAVANHRQRPIFRLPDGLQLGFRFCYIAFFVTSGAHVPQVRVWDLPTRVFHWLLVLLVSGLIATGQWGGDAMVWHFRLGYGVLVLLLFRLIWGLIGGHWSRFAVFVRSPLAVLRYVRGVSHGDPGLGHNPLGAYSVIALLAILFAQVLSGLFSDDEIAATGPLSKLANSQWVNWATDYHTEIGKFVLLGLVGLHIGALLFYRWRGDRTMIPAMWHGFKPSATVSEIVRDNSRSRVGALLSIAACAAAVAGLLTWLG